MSKICPFSLSKDSVRYCNQGHPDYNSRVCMAWAMGDPKSETGCPGYCKLINR
jgi:hypothetical protein